MYRATLPDRLHLLGLKQRLLGGLQPLVCGLLRGDVAGNRIDVIPVRDASPGQPAVRSVLVPKTALELHGEVALDQLVDLSPDQSAIVRMLQPFRGAVQ